MTEIRELAKFISAFDSGSAPEQVVAAAARCVLDTVGVAVGASRRCETRSAIEVLTAGESGACAVWGSPVRVSPATAAFCNAMLSHYLELDDVHPRSKTHIGAVVVPAAWAVAEHLRLGGSRLLEAVICGYETASRIGMGFGVKSHRERGWHVTGTAGTFGAAAACAKLLGLDEEQTVSALGMAGTQSAGLWAFLQDGADCKVLHTGNSARAGLTAAFLARSGMRGAEHILDAADGGLFPAMSDAYDYTLVSASLGETFEILQVENKPYPCCRSAHCAIDAALSLRSDPGFSVGGVSGVTVKTYQIGYLQCGCTEGSKRPSTPTAAKFSTPYSVACALLYGGIEEKSFQPPVLGSEEVMRLCERVSVVPDSEFTARYPAHWGCELTVACADGSVLTRVVNDPFGSKANPITDENLCQKVRPMLDEAFGCRGGELTERLLSLDGADVLPDMSAVSVR